MIIFQLSIDLNFGGNMLVQTCHLRSVCGDFVNLLTFVGLFSVSQSLFNTNDFFLSRPYENIF